MIYDNYQSTTRECSSICDVEYTCPRGHAAAFEWTRRALRVRMAHIHFVFMEQPRLSRVRPSFFARSLAARAPLPPATANAPPFLPPLCWPSTVNFRPTPPNRRPTTPVPSSFSSSCPSNSNNHPPIHPFPRPHPSPVTPHLTPYLHSLPSPLILHAGVSSLFSGATPPSLRTKVHPSPFQS